MYIYHHVLNNMLLTQEKVKYQIQVLCIMNKANKTGKCIKDAKKSFLADRSFEFFQKLIAGINRPRFKSVASIRNTELVK